MDHNTFRDGFVNTIIKDGKITVMGGQTETFGKAVNVKQFLAELNELLGALGFKDNWNVGNYAKAGEFVDAKIPNRTGNMYETAYVSIKKGFADELEIVWEAKRPKLPESDYGSVYYKFYLVNRFMADKEITDENGNKKTVQGGDWEFRNEIVYKNDVVNKYLSKIPIVKNSESLQRLYLERFYYPQLENDFLWCINKVKGKTNELLYKHFT